MSRIGQAEITIIDINDGSTGPSGSNTAVVSLYKNHTSNSTAPTSFTGTATYTFSTGVVSGLTLNSWSQSPPTLANGEYLWVRQAVATSTTSTDTIAIGEWSTATVVGYSGINGLNSKPIFLYIVNSSTTAPTAFTGTATYTFSSDTLAGLTLNGWSRTAPSLSKGQYLWMRSAMATSTSDTDTIAIGEWSIAAIVGIGGVDGATGATGARGAGWWRYDAGAVDLSGVDTTAEVNVYWNALHNPDILAVKDDRFIIATTHTSGTKAFIYDGTNWVSQSAFVDGNLLVNGTVTGNALMANSVTADKLSVTSLEAVSATIGTLQSAASGARLVIQDNKISVYDSNNVLRVLIGDLT